VSATEHDSTIRGGKLDESLRAVYERRLVGIRQAFEATGDGLACAHARSALVDELVMQLWKAELAAEPKLAAGVAVAAVGGYGRGVLFPSSDVDLLFCVDKAHMARSRDPIRRLSQALWDCGMQVAATTRMPSECDKFDPGNAEFGLALMDLRRVGGEAQLFARLEARTSPRRWMKEARVIGAELARLTRERHVKYGNTLFHLEPNIKDCPGGLRDANVCHWLHKLSTGEDVPEGKDQSDDLYEGLTFLAAVRCFLHYRHGRDDNTLDWRAQDAAAEQGIGLGRRALAVAQSVDPAYWMRAYFRHARLIERRLVQEMEAAGLRLKPAAAQKKLRLKADAGFRLKSGRLELDPAEAGEDPAHDPDIVLSVFAAMATTGATLAPDIEQRIVDGIPRLSSLLEEGPGLWRQLSAILTGPEAADALRSMHALGVLELILPEFHGIDALVIRDAYHRYTVDEHTFVLIETLHALEKEPAADAPEWRLKFGSMVRELQNPGLLYLAAILHDTGKGRVSDDHAAESARLARGVLDRLEMDAYDAALVLRLIEMHLEMSSALRRDIFDVEAVRAFAGKVQTHELLRMLTLLTYADIHAVHPDALTPWKAENLWRLSMRTANHLDRNVDEERVHAGGKAGGSSWKGSSEKTAAVLAMAGVKRSQVEHFLEGFPERYLQTRSSGDILRHFEMTEHFAEEPFQMELRRGTALSEITLVTRDRPRLFAGMAGALAAWGMNVVTADAFANAEGVVVDNFRFSDTFRTLELNEGERERFVGSLRELLDGRASAEQMLRSRRRGRRKAVRRVVETSIEFDDAASAHSTLLQVVAQDFPGLLRAISATLSEQGLNVEVALIDTEGEMAIDVFYLTTAGVGMNHDQELTLRQALLKAIEENANDAR
jgi:[protein-PII] uridylyltransferase